MKRKTAIDINYKLGEIVGITRGIVGKASGRTADQIRESYERWQKEPCYAPAFEDLKRLEDKVASIRLMINAMVVD